MNMICKNNLTKEVHIYTLKTIKHCCKNVVEKNQSPKRRHLYVDGSKVFILLLRWRY